jgi:hypothetical protein
MRLDFGAGRYHHPKASENNGSWIVSIPRQNITMANILPLTHSIQRKASKKYKP